MVAEEQVKKWEDSATAELKGVTAGQVWPLILDDFCSFHKWLPTIDTCRHVEGVSGQPGLVRFCASKQTNSSSTFLDGESGETGTNWCLEKLVAVDPVVRALSYEVLDNNLGIKSCVTTIKVLPTKVDGDDEGGNGCQIQWSFSADPFEGLMTCDGFSSYINFALQGMAENMERALRSS